MVLILSVLIGITLDLTGAKPAVKYYASKYDHIDVEAILNNRRMVNYYSACLLSQGPCPPEGVELKRILPEALRTNCARCTEKQATVALRAIRRLKKEYPKIWFQLSQMWDASDIYVKKFESTFGTNGGSTTPVKESSFNVNSLTPGDDQPTDNAIDGDFSRMSTTDFPPSSTAKQLQKTTHIVITSPNVIHLSSTSTNANQSPSRPSTASTTSTTVAISRIPTKPITSTRLPSSSSSSTMGTSTTTSTTTARSTTTTRISSILPGFVPLNTFFTNPPIPIRPIVDINIGANIGATVKAIKQINKMVAGIALEKIKKVFSMPWKRTRRKNS